jgi:glycosyltransferase involved in cell wall biosynthesis
MKIAHLIPQFYPYFGGAEVCVHNVCESLVRAGHEAVVITTTSPPEKKPRLDYEVIHLSPATCGLLRRFPFAGKIYLARRLAQIQKKYEFDLWQVTNGFPVGVYSVDFFNRKNIPCVLRCCGEDIQKYPEINYGYRLDSKIDALVMNKYRKFDGFVALTESVRKEYLDMGIDEGRIKIIPNGVDCEAFRDAGGLEKKEKVLSELGIPKGRKLLLTVGRYHPKKGYDRIPLIARELKKRGIDFVWIVAGRDSGKIAEKFPDCAEYGVVPKDNFSKNGIDGEIFSLPPTGLKELYRAADIFVLPTLMETFGMVLVEAMAAGLPVVTTDAPGVRDVITDGINGLKAGATDIDGIADCVMRIADDENLASKLSGNALEEAGKIYDWKCVTRQYSDFYVEVSGKGD